MELVALNDDAEAGEDDGGVDPGGLGGDAEDGLAVDFLGGGALRTMEPRGESTDLISW